MAQTTDNQLWLAMWRNQQTEFHQQQVNPFLSEHWHEMAMPRRARIFVPLCGKSLDLLWLSQQGHEVIGVELSSVAVKAFFDENGLKPVKRRIGSFMVWRHERITILCGDFFALKATSVGRIDAVYDRAALTALPEALRQAYVDKMQLIMPVADQVFLLTLEDFNAGDTEQAWGGVDEEVERLYARYFDIAVTHAERVDDDNAVLGSGYSACKVYQMMAHHH